MSEPISLTLYDSYKKTNTVINPHTSVQYGTLKMYSCGPTVYQYQHIGNMRAIWLPNTFRDIASLGGWQVEWVLNITDVGHLIGDGDEGINVSAAEDKLEKSARKEGKTPQEIVNYYSQDFVSQTQALHIHMPVGENNPKATEYILEQMLIALTLLKEHRAYILEDGIYFDSSANQDLTVPFKLYQGDREYTGREIKSKTKNPMDFALWKFVTESSLQKWKFNHFDETAELMSQIMQIIDAEFYDLPNRWGCPGWHTECVAMICKILNGSLPPLTSKNNTVIDVHFGGEDHIDIHHKNEILQSEAMHFHLSQIWAHNKFVLVDGKKMSKSIGNVFLVTGAKSITGFDSILEKGYDPLAYRLLMFEHHYTQQLDFTWDKISQSQNRLFNMRKDAARLKRYIDLHQDENYHPTSNLELKDLFLRILSENINTPKFVNDYSLVLTNLVNELQSENIIDMSAYEVLAEFENEILRLNLFPEIPNNIAQLAATRWNHKISKNYEEADTIRQSIESMGWMVDDYNDGYGIWMRYNTILK